jgi:peptide subunit release factor 1 (eRF1)
MEDNQKFNDILFIISPAYPDNPKKCKICGVDNNSQNFSKETSSICRECQSRESNFCRTRMILIRVSKKLNVPADVAVRIVQEEREKIYKDVSNRKEKVVVI